MHDLWTALKQFFFWIMLLLIPVSLILSLTLLLLAIVRLIQMLAAERGSGRRKDLKQSMLRCLTVAAVLFVCLVLLAVVFAHLGLANM